ncbi:MAG: hypothetical protein CL706_06660 [Chloroflexi bacterium]|nr:hypothetical protein [Chloroflexota bacterium]|tara:strand:- start:91 stop:840 length:750 start_codon:yes stop_codon:yes gene_type:complete
MPYFRPYPRFVFGGGNNFRNLLNKLSDTVDINQESANVFAADNLIAINRITGFLKEEKFVDLANKFFQNDDFHASIIWRIHILSWAVDSCKNLDGDMIEFGCYDGSVAEFIINYNDLFEFKNNFYLYDIFNNPPVGSGEKHTKDLLISVQDRMKKYNFVKVIPGLLPSSFSDKIPKKISFVHLDLNSAETEIELLKLFFDRLVPGGIVILDDYATMYYEDQHNSEKSFFKSLGYKVVELPSGQGMVIKR